MSNNKLNHTNLKSVAGGKGGASNTRAVEKAKAIVKQELKKESLTKAAGTSPLRVQASGGSSGEARLIPGPRPSPQDRR